jgi:5'-methylthioadenosine phosphorylase
VRAEVGVFGGSGFYRFLGDMTEVQVDTPFGTPSQGLAVGQVEGRSVAFLPRHGLRHSLAPHAINYRANLWALRELGVTRVIGPCAAGSLQPHVRPGDLVVCDQFVDRTWGREDSFHLEGRVAHVGAANPYCRELRALAVETARSSGMTVHEDGTVVVVQGPRFSTTAESRWYSTQGWHLVNMTQYPEVVLARELEMCYVNISLATDYDAGLAGVPGVDAVSAREVERVFAENLDRLRTMLAALIPRIPAEPGCDCRSAMAGAFIGG